MAGDHSNDDYRGLVFIHVVQKIAPVNTTFWILCKHMSVFVILIYLTIGSAWCHYNVVTHTVCAQICFSIHIIIGSGTAELWQQNVQQKPHSATVLYFPVFSVDCSSVKQ